MTKTVDYYYSVISPFTYLGGDRLEAIAGKHGATIVYKPVDIMAVFNETGGTPPPKRHPSRQAYRLVELERVARRFGMPINLKPAHFPVDQKPASLAVLAAVAQGHDVGALSQGFLRAVWAEERNIADPATVQAILAENGFDAAAILEAAPSQAETFDRLTREAIEGGVFGMPSYVYRGEIFFGQDRLDYLEDALAA